MSRDIIVRCIEGYSESIKDDDKTTSSVIDKIVKKHNERICDYSITESKIIIFDYKEMIYNILLKINGVNNPNLIIIGKSMGGVNAYKLYNKMFKHFVYFNKVILFLIDAHAPLPFLIGDVKNLRVRRKWRNFENRKFINIYQKNSYPRGASLSHADIDHRLNNSDVDHWNIFKHNTTVELLEDSFEYLALDI